MNPDWQPHWLDATPQTNLVNGMRWRPLDGDSDVEVPSWSWLVSPRAEEPQ